MDAFHFPDFKHLRKEVLPLADGFYVLYPQKALLIFSSNEHYNGKFPK